MAVMLPLPSTALQDPAKWNSEWEAVFRLPELASSSSIAMIDPKLCFDLAVGELEKAPLNAEGTLSGLQARMTQTAAVQRNVTEEALKHFNFGDLEARWMAAGADERGRHILGAMAAVCSKALNLNNSRIYCAAELRLSRLRLSGKIFLDLLKSAMLEDASFIPATPTYISHPRWDSFAAEQGRKNDTENKKLALSEVLLLRTKLICHVLQFTLRSFMGLEPPELVVQKEHKKVQNARDPLKAQRVAELVDIIGQDGARARLKDAKHGWKGRMGQRLAHCSYMGCHNAETPDAPQKFSRCKKCYDTMQRQVLYCSSECQLADWKLRHKAVCGKPLDFDTVSQPIAHPTSVPNSARRIGLPVNGYKRSLALATQVTQLNSTPTVDYYLFPRDRLPYIFDFGAGSYVQVVFRAAREKAMTTGDRTSVGKMAHMLCAAFIARDAPNAGVITPGMVVEQFAREYVFDDVRALVLEMQELQSRDPLKRPPLLADAPLDIWASILQVANFAEIVVALD